MTDDTLKALKALASIPPETLDGSAEREFVCAVLAGFPLDSLDRELPARIFINRRATVVYRAILQVHEAGEKITPATVKDRLEPKMWPVLLEFTAPQTWIPPEAAPDLARVIHAQHARREVWQIGTRLVQVASDPDRDPEDMLDAARSSLDWADDDRSDGQDIGDVLPDLMDQLERGEAPGIGSGFHDLDDWTGGLRPGELVIVGAGTGVGKTIFAGNIATHLAVRKRLPVWMASLEMTRLEMTRRAVASIASVHLSRMVQPKFLTPDDWDAIGRVTPQVADATWRIVDSANQTLPSLRAQLRRYTRRIRRNPALVVVDYLQQVQGVDKRSSREQEVAATAAGLKALAKEFETTVVAPAQINRNNVHRADKRPAIGDMRESAAIEQYADVVVLLHRPDMFDPEDRPGELEVIVGKNRHGPMGQFPMVFQPHYSRALSYSDRDWSPSSQAVE